MRRLFCWGGFDREMYDNQRGFMLKAPPVWYPLRCTLEELYNGAEKRVNLYTQDKLVQYNHGNTFGTVDPKVIVVKISPGSRDGDQIVFPGQGAVLDGMIPGDIIFVVEEVPHEVFKRTGNDLSTVVKIPLIEFLTKEDTLKLETLDKRSITVRKPQPGRVMEILNEGMHIPDLGIKGSLFIKYEVILPMNLSLTDEEKDELKKLLSEKDNQPLNYEATD
ncbi:hypothetical protein ACH5RR_025768 [Cinchona calisaya]|uniref:Chaperone DnaJ C-terminal domain-containing protein n=1 Tax=Cinchona calisaya TaxID=153742 RepID=A0ABD2Z0L2_9GENT